MVSSIIKKKTWDKYDETMRFEKGADKKTGKKLLAMG